jgi:hypothetical protein
MHFAAPLLLISRWMRRSTRRPARALEPADMGTAFGMEQWLDEADSALPAAPAAGARRWWSPRWPRRAASH